MKCSKKTCLIILAIFLFLVAVAVALLVVFLILPRDNSTAPPRARTKTAGTILGQTVVLKDKETQIHEFHNIRYAKPPVGELRFRPPVKHTAENPEELVEATNSTEILCIQADNGDGTEDCLVLTVRTANLNASKPVLVWLHGGGLATNHGMMGGYSFDSEVTHKVEAVTVNVNFRLGFIGFSSVEELWDEEAGVYANNGIRDMIAALNWIQENIAGFGGDPDSVTVIGESGGATAVLALACSPLANNKFHAGIAQSPAPEMRFTHVDGDKYQRTIVDQVGCTQNSKEERKKCLLDLPAEKFSRKYIDIVNGDAYFTFPRSQGEDADVVGLVVIDPVVVTVPPRELSSAGFVPDKPLPVIISNLAEENFEWAWIIKPPFSSEEELKSTLGPLLKNLTDDADVLDKVLAIYPDQDPVTVWSLLTCDMRATCPSNDVALAMSTASNRDIYRLYISHRPSLGIPAVHAYDSVVLFGYGSGASNGGGGFSFSPVELDLKFERHYISMVKQLAQNKKFDDGWETFPGKSMIYENSDEISNVMSNKPQQTECEKLAELDLVKYGWQNR
ncbi:hypothetical protein ACHWQZ_G000529 [Mnemiopsis leidyi]